MRPLFWNLGFFAFFVTTPSFSTFASESCESSLKRDQRIEAMLDRLNRRHFKMSLHGRALAQARLQTELKNSLNNLSLSQLRALGHGLATFRAPLLSLRSKWTEHLVISEWHFRIFVDQRPEHLAEWFDFILRKKPFAHKKVQKEVLDFDTISDIIQVIVDADRNGFQFSEQVIDDVVSTFLIALEAMKEKVLSQIKNKERSGLELWDSVQPSTALLSRTLTDRPDFLSHPRFVSALLNYRDFLLDLARTHGFEAQARDSLGLIILEM